MMTIIYLKSIVQILTIHKKKEKCKKCVYITTVLINNDNNDEKTRHQEASTMCISMLDGSCALKCKC